MFTVYALCEPDTGEIRYVGCTKNALGLRVAAHLTTARVSGHGPVRSWIRSLMDRGLVPLDIALEQWPTADEAGEREGEIVRSLRASGVSLANSEHPRPYTAAYALRRGGGRRGRPMRSWTETPANAPRRKGAA